MKINIKATNLELTPAISTYIETKIGSLTRFLKKIETKSEVETHFEIARTTRHHRQGNIFCAEATFYLPGKTLRAEHSDWDIRVAIDKVKDKLQQEIKKYKGLGLNFRASRR
jgi:ribosomal subunit interface protein